MHNCKSKTKLIHEIQGGTRGATYGLLNCDATVWVFQCEMRQIESETELIKNWRDRQSVNSLQGHVVPLIVY